MDNTQTRIETEPSGQKNQRHLDESQGLKGDKEKNNAVMTGRTGHTHTGTVYINEGINKQQEEGTDLLMVQGTNVPPNQAQTGDKKHQMRTHISFGGQQRANQGNQRDRSGANDQQNRNGSKGIQQESNNKWKMKRYLAQRLRQQTPLFENNDRGYHSGTDP